MSGFVDEAQLHVKAGDGGAGAVAMRREAHVDKGGPDGGDGGRGGNVWLVATTNQSSLLPFRDHPHRGADNGGHGGGKKMHGKRGGDLEVPVPVGTRARRADGTLLCDLANAGRPVAGRRGRPGRPGQRQLPLQQPAGAHLRRAGREGPRGVVRPRAGPGGRRGPGRVSQRGQVDPDLADLGGQAEDRRLPLHHPRAPPGRGAGRRRDELHRGRHPRPGRGGGRGQGARPPVPPPHHPGPGPGRAGRARPGDRGVPGRAAPGAHRRARPLPARPAGPAPPGGRIEGRHGGPRGPAGAGHRPETFDRGDRCRPTGTDSVPTWSSRRSPVRGSRPWSGGSPPWSTRPAPPSPSPTGPS